MRSFSLVALLALSAQVAFSQQTPVAGRTTTLTLEDAISIAQRNNPALHQIQNNVRTQDAQVRSAYGQLLPTAGAARFRAEFTDARFRARFAAVIPAADLPPPLPAVDRCA